MQTDITFRVTCIKNTEGPDIHGQVPQIPKVGDEDLQVGKAYFAARVSPATGISGRTSVGGLLVIMHNGKAAAVLPEDWFVD